MHLSDWMNKEGHDDEKVANLTGFDRVTISRTRRRVTKPSDGLLAELYRISNGAMTANDFFHTETAA